MREVELAQLIELVGKVVGQARDLVLGCVDGFERLARLPPIGVVGQLDGCDIPNLIGQRGQLPTLQLQLAILPCTLQDLGEVTPTACHQRRVRLPFVPLPLGATGQRRWLHDLTL